MITIIKLNIYLKNSNSVLSYEVETPDALVFVNNFKNNDIPDDTLFEIGSASALVYVYKGDISAISVEK